LQGQDDRQMKRDNRIPDSIDRFSEETPPGDEMSFLTFKDWRAKKVNKEWTLVAQLNKNDEENFGTYSVLASAKEGDIEKILSSYDWDISMDFGKPYFEGTQQAKQYFIGDKWESNGVDFYPFIIYRSFRGYTPHVFEFTQNFILHYNAFYVKETEEYQHITTEGEIHTIAKFEYRNEENLKVLVNTHFLRNYLAARKCLLVRYHDHNRFVEQPTVQIEGRVKTEDVRSKNMFYEITIRPRYKGDDTMLSKLFGKDIITPYDDASDPNLFDKYRKQYESFIIGFDDSGEEIIETCDKSKLSSFFEDRGKPHFLTSVFFTRNVLTKYLNEPSRYRASRAGVECLTLWSIELDETDNGLLHAWLGDLGRIPYKEQKHWRSYNVAPTGSVRRRRFERDFLNLVSEDSSDILYLFRKTFELVQKRTTEIFQEPLLKNLDDRDQHLYDSLHLPVTEEWKEFDDQVNALAKLAADSLNVKILQDLTGLKISRESGIKGSIDLLEKYLESLGVDRGDIDTVSRGLRMVQTLRSTGGVHRKSTNFDDALRRYNLEHITHYEKIKVVLHSLTESLSVLYSIFSAVKSKPENS
jgi:hypothetical protein